MTSYTGTTPYPKAAPSGLTYNGDGIYAPVPWYAWDWGYGDVYAETYRIDTGGGGGTGVTPKQVVFT